MSIKQNIILTINNLHNLPKYLNIRNELVHERFQTSLTIKPLENLTKMQLWTIKTVDLQSLQPESNIFCLRIGIMDCIIETFHQDFRWPLFKIKLLICTTFSIMLRTTAS